MDSYVFEFGPRTAVGDGCNGSVYCCWRKSDSKAFAVKLFPFNERSRNEILAWQTCTPHPHIVTLVEVIDAGLLPPDHPLLAGLRSDIIAESQGVHVLLAIMDLLPGGDLQKAMKLAHMGNYEVASIVGQVASALDHMHSHGLVHGDVKLENILIESVDPLHVRVADFGFARNFMQQPCPGSTRCSARYLAPELLVSFSSFAAFGHFTRVGPSSDMWTLGVCAYILATRRVPFLEAAPTCAPDTLIAATAQGALPADASWWTGLTPWARRAVEYLMNMDARERPTAGEVVAMLEPSGLLDVLGLAQ
jgi:serine/threonine protein kinase